MNKVVAFFQNDHIKMALASGLCIVLLAIVFKKLLNLEISNLESAVPGFVFTGWEVARKNIKNEFWAKASTWGYLTILATALVIINRALF